jgi:hypothetical protein
MRTSLKLKRLVKKYTSYMRYDPARNTETELNLYLEKVYCIRESDMVKFIDDVIELHEQTGFRKCNGTL